MSLSLSTLFGDISSINLFSSKLVLNSSLENSIYSASRTSQTVRLDVYSNINKLYDDNSDCIVSGDQEISTEQVKEAEKDLSDFISKYEN